MLYVPRLRQPDEVSCLPTAVTSVLRFHGYPAEYADVAAACKLGPLGALQEISIQGLLETGYDVEVMSEFDSSSLRDALEQERPVIVTLIGGSLASGEFGHAVVACGLDEDAVMVMDPAQGDYIRVPWGSFVQRVGKGISGALIIGAAQQAAP